MNSKLDWVKNYSGHDSTAQNSIWHCIMMLSNFEVVKADIDGFEADSIINGEKDFYIFMKALYQDMYANPDKYAIPTAAYDEYMKNINTADFFANEHKNDAKEGKLRQAFQEAIQFYPDYFYQLGLAADEICNKNYALIIPKSKYTNVLNNLDRPHIRKKNEQRLNALADMGITVNEINGTCHISCIHAPKMFLGLQVLCEAPNSKYKYMNYLRLDYKGHYRAMPEIEDIKMTMEKNHSDILCLLLTLFDNPKTKSKLYPLRSITSNHKWKVEYSLNSKRVFEFYAGPAYLVFHIFFKSTESLTEIIDLLESNDYEFFEWLRDKFIEKICNCPRNKTVMFGNQEKRICGSTNKVEIMNPTEDDAKKSVELIKMLNS